MKRIVKNKKGGLDLLTGNLTFIILNVAFLTILILFLTGQGNGARSLEQLYAKQIALIIDSSNPAMTIIVDMEKGRAVADENEIPFSEVVKISGNNVIVTLSKGGGYTYSFFNDVEVGGYPDEGEFENMYVLTVTKKEVENE